MPLSYYDLLEKPDWYQSFNGNANVTTQLPYTLKTGAGRVARQFVNDAPPGVGTHCMELQPSQQIECELITSLADAYPRQAGQTSMGATYEFWIKIPSGFTITQDYKLLFREKVSSGNTIFDRIALSTDFRIVVKGSNNGSNGNAFLMSSSQIQSDPLGFDTWHHISIVYADDTLFSSATTLRGYANIFLYQNGILIGVLEGGTELSSANQSSTTGGITSSNFYQFGWEGSRGMIFNGEVTNDGGHFAQWNTTTIPIKIAGFAMWHKTAQTQKQIARRYMYGIAAQKQRQRDLITASGPWFACDMNNVSWDGTSETFQTQFGSNVTSGGSWGTSLQTGSVNNLTLKNPDSLESNGISATGTWTNNFSGQIQFDAGRGAALNDLHMSGNFSFETWVKWGLTKNNFKPNKPAAGPVINMFAYGGVIHVVRTSSDGRIEFINRFNDASPTTSNNTGPLSQKLITDNDWVHLAFTCQNVAGTLTLRYYINGRQFAQRTVTGNLANPTLGTVNQLALFFAGNAVQAEPKTMDIFAIYDRSLSTSEIRQRYLSYAALDRNAAYWDGVKWKIPTANKYWNGTEWSFWNDKVKRYDGTNWVMV